jgi:SAM-dependent methyltransferase
MRPLKGIDGVSHSPDPANGYDHHAAEFARRRGGAAIGADAVRAWASSLRPGAEVLDAGCGTGIPITRALIDAGCRVWALDASPRMVEAFRRNLPQIPVLAEPVETSPYFDRDFDGVVAWGLLFLLPEESQPLTLARLAAILRPGGRLLFTAPWQAASWTDLLTQRLSVSIGREAYLAALNAAGLRLVGEFEDEGANHYYDAVRTTP